MKKNNIRTWGPRIFFAMGAITILDTTAEAQCSWGMNGVVGQNCGQVTHQAVQPPVQYQEAPPNPMLNQINPNQQQPTTLYGPPGYPNIRVMPRQGYNQSEN